MIATTWLVATSIEELPTFFDAANVSHPAQLMVHSIVRDAHHRGRITALLRQGGGSEEERELLEEATWTLWRECSGNRVDGGAPPGPEPERSVLPGSSS